MVAACRPVSTPSPPASKPNSRTPGSATKAWNAPIAFEPAHTGADRVRQLAGQVQHLLPCLDTEGADEVPDHPRERVRAGRGAEQVVSVVDVGHPIAEG